MDSPVTRDKVGAQINTGNVVVHRISLHWAALLERDKMK